MNLFLRFMGWLIVYSLFYFISLDITSNPPGTESNAFHKIFNWGILLIVSIPVWWITWKKFENTFGPRTSESLAGGGKTYFFALRNPALMYYLMTLKIFLLAMGLNGLLTLSHHKSGMKTFYIINFIVLYLYAVPFFLIKFKKLKKSLKSRLIMDPHKLAFDIDGDTITEIPISKIDKILCDNNGPAMLVKAGTDSIYIGGPQAKASGFFIEGASDICEKLKSTTQEKIVHVDSIKQSMKADGIKPAI
jgi:hypothetical protein